MRARIANGGMDLWAMLAAAAIATLLLIAATQMEAQSFTVLHTFPAGADGANPSAGDLVMDGQGDLFGTTYIGGSGQGCSGYGVVFEIAPN